MNIFLVYDHSSGDGPIVPLQMTGPGIVPVRLLWRTPYSFRGENLKDVLSGLYPRIVSYANSIRTNDEKGGEERE